MEKKSQTGMIILILILLILAGALVYLMILQRSPERFILKTTANISSYNGTLQFYPNMRFATKTPIYFIDNSCSEEKITRMTYAFSRLENETILKFNQASINPDILITCEETDAKPGETFIAGEGGAKTIINAGKFYIIQDGEILLLYKQSCKNYNVELHELLHVLGFKHSDNENSLMYNLSSCNQELTQDILDEINRLYLIPELPDLYLINVTAVKHGSYLLQYIDFSVDVKNQGLALASDILLEVYSDSNKIESFNLGNLSSGEGRYLNAKNIKFSGDKVSFIAKENEHDLDSSNNRVDLVISG